MEDGQRQEFCLGAHPVALTAPLPCEEVTLQRSEGSPGARGAEPHGQGDQGWLRSLGRALTLSLWSKSTELETDVRRSYRS